MGTINLNLAEEEGLHRHNTAHQMPADSSASGNGVQCKNRYSPDGLLKCVAIAKLVEDVPDASKGKIALTSPSSQRVRHANAEM